MGPDAHQFVIGPHLDENLALTRRAFQQFPQFFILIARGSLIDETNHHLTRLLLDRLRQFANLVDDDRSRSVIANLHADIHEDCSFFHQQRTISAIRFGPKHTLYRAALVLESKNGKAITFLRRL